MDDDIREAREKFLGSCPDRREVHEPAEKFLTKTLEDREEPPLRRVDALDTLTDPKAQRSTSGQEAIDTFNKNAKTNGKDSEVKGEVDRRRR